MLTVLLRRHGVLKRLLHGFCGQPTGPLAPHMSPETVGDSQDPARAANGPQGGHVLGLALAHVGADEAAVPGPPVLGVRRRVDADEAAAAVDEILERALLRDAEDVTGEGLAPSASLTLQQGPTSGNKTIVIGRVR